MQRRDDSLESQICSSNDWSVRSWKVIEFSSLIAGAYQLERLAEAFLPRCSVWRSLKAIWVTQTRASLVRHIIISWLFADLFLPRATDENQSEITSVEPIIELSTYVDNHATNRNFRERYSHERWQHFGAGAEVDGSSSSALLAWSMRIKFRWLSTNKFLW